MFTTKSSLLAAMVLGLAGMAFTPQANATEFKATVGAIPTPVVQTDRHFRRWVPAHYELRPQQVLVRPGCYETRSVNVLIPGGYVIENAPVYGGVYFGGERHDRDFHGERGHDRFERR